MICITLDTDWCPDEVLAYSIQLIEDYGQKATLFATHRSALFCDAGCKFEIGIHPNFNPLLEGEGGNYKSAISELKNLFPDATGFRSHSVATSGPILDYCADVGLIYEANQYYPFQVPMFKDYNGLARLSNFWGDLHQLLSSKKFEFEDSNYDGSLPAVFVFHPVHVFLNTEKPERYQRAKEFYHDSKRLVEFRNDSAVPGVKDFLKQLLAYANKNSVSYTAAEIVNTQSTKLVVR